MQEKKKETTTGVRHVKRPIRRSLIVMLISMFAVIVILVTIVACVFFPNVLYDQFDEKITGVVDFIEAVIDADDMDQCIKTGVQSEKYNQTQELLNTMIDNIGVDYIYIGIPDKDVIINVISATSSEEFAAGDDNWPLLETTDAYTEEEIARFASFWDNEEIGFFEETSEYGTYYTGVKPLRNSKGETIAIICVDLLSSDLRSMVNSTVSISILIVSAVFGIFALALGLWIYHSVTQPIRSLEESAKRFAAVSENDELKYEAPEIKTQNEIRSLGDAIEKMTGDISDFIRDREESEKKMREMDEENIRLSEKAAATAKIEELSNSMQALLDNMPALSFYKNSETGVYLACNQAFADYAGKPAPQDVIGLTDYDLFTEAAARKFIEDDKKALEMSVPYILLETVPGANGVMRTFQTTKLKFKDGSGEERLLGMCYDMTEMAQAKKESEKAREAYEAAMSTSLTYTKIARTLSTDYRYIYYVNIVTDEFIEYKSEQSGEDLNVERRGSDFFKTSCENAKTLLHKDDSPAFIAAFNKENVLHSIDTTGIFSATYRMVNTGEPIYMNMKGTRISDDAEHILLGVSNVDAQMRDRVALEHLQEEQATYERITALSGDFLAMYTVNPETERYTEYSSMKDYSDIGLQKEGTDFFSRLQIDAKAVIHPDDLDLISEMMTKEKILKEIKEHGLFALTYRLMINGEPIYAMLKAAMIEEKDGQKQLIIGVNNIDAQVKREQEYDYNLSVERTKANIDSLTGVKNKHAYIDAETALNTKIEEKLPVEFAIIVFDVNGLKKVNDTQGHRAGDELIRGACKIICDSFGHSPVFRIGGDEFVVIAQGQDYEHRAAITAEIAEINLKNKESGGVVIACGMSEFDGDRNTAEVFERADKAMYENKRQLKL